MKQGAIKNKLKKNYRPVNLKKLSNFIGNSLKRRD
jgi:hypothetical protein